MWIQDHKKRVKNGLCWTFELIGLKRKDYAGSDLKIRVKEVKKMFNWRVCKCNWGGVDWPFWEMHVGINIKVEKKYKRIPLYKNRKET